MQINNITNCRKPQRFTGLKETGKVKYKHYEQMSDAALSTYSTLKAYKDVKESKKSRLLEAMPAIATSLLATSLAITQPGKLSRKVSTGVGFLVLAGAMDFLSNKFSDLTYKILNKKNENKDNKTNLQNKIKSGFIGTLAAIGAVTAAAVGISKNKTNIVNSSNKAVKFIQSEGQKLANELNNTKLGKVIEERFMPFMQRHPKAFSMAKNIAPVGIILGHGIVSSKLNKSLSKDLANKTLQNYIKGKAAQQDARAHFDSIDAIEV